MAEETIIREFRKDDLAAIVELSSQPTERDSSGSV
jgi:hypothetical protein